MKLMSLSEYIKNVRLEEELTTKQKAKVDQMPDPERSIKTMHDSVFGHGNEKIIMPYDSSEDEKITTEHARTHKIHYASHAGNVLRKLNDNGYKTDDYESGVAYHIDKPERKLKIGKILEKESFGKEPTNITTRTGTTLNLKQAYDADPIRASSKNGEKQIVITRNRYDVAGMSTGRSGWSSCMNMDDGCNRHYIPNDMRHGTITAYITRKGDDDIKEPIGRINIKRFANDNHADIFRPEGRGYGSIPSNAHKVITKWTEEKYPSKPGVYIKPTALYNDDGQMIRMEHPDKLLGGKGHEEVRKAHDSAADQIVRGVADAYNNIQYGGKYDHFGGLGDHDEAVVSVKHQINGMIKPLTPGAKLHMAAHYLADKLGEDDTEHVNDINIGEQRYGDPFMRNWAHEYVHNNNRRNTELEGAIDALPHDDALAYHKKFHEAAKKSIGDYDDHASASELHSMIMNHIIKHGPESHKHEVLNDIMTTGDDDQKNYYHTLLNTHMTEMDRQHPVQMVTNPRTMHHFMHGDNEEELDLSKPLSGNKEAWHHIGMHADEKLAKEWRDGDISHRNNDTDTQLSFYKGLAKNPNGEEISHHLLNDTINFHGGESGTQRAMHDNFVNIHGRPMNGDSALSSHRYRSDSAKFHDFASDENIREHFVDLAHTTPHKSVIDVLKNREDLKSDENIQDALKYNPKHKELYGNQA